MAFAGAALGFERSARVKRRARLLSALCAALGVMAEEISLLRTPLPELFAQLAERGPEESRAFFAGLSAADGSPLSERWSACADALPLAGAQPGTLRRCSSVRADRAHARASSAHDRPGPLGARRKGENICRPGAVAGGDAGGHSFIELIIKRIIE